MANALFLVPYPVGKAPAQSLRPEQYPDALAVAGHTRQLPPFLTEATWNSPHKPGQTAESGD